MDEKKCEEMIEKVERLEKERDKCIEKGDLNGAIEKFKKIIKLDKEMLRKCDEECAHKMESY